MSYTKSILLLIVLILFSLFFSIILKDNFGTNTVYVNDYGDRLVYAGRGSWYSLPKVPYIEVESEYPQLATGLMTVPYLVLSVFDSINYSEAEEIYNYITVENL